MLAENVSARDRQALEYLEDVRYNRGDRGMLIEFHFLENPFFENKVSFKKLGPLGYPRIRCVLYWDLFFIIISLSYEWGKYFNRPGRMY